MAGFPVLSTMQGPPITDLYNTTNHADDSNPLHNSFGQAHNAEFQEQFTTRTSLVENPNSWAHLLDDAMRAQAYSNALNISFATSINHGYHDDEDEVNFLDPNGSIWPNNSAHQYSSLSLATSPSSATRTSTISDVTHQGFNDRGFGAEHNSCNSKELSLSFGSQEASPWSMYLQVIQDILSQIATYSLQNFDHMGHSHSTLGMRSASYLPHSSSSSIDLQLHKQALETKKSQLLTLLQVVDDRYNQCMDEIHTVISAFHAATELDPQKHASFALRTITVLYKSMRERISSHILSMGGAEFRSIGKREEDMSFEASFIQKQWALQQHKRKEHQLWRPQRGLPEKSVSVLRAWMFQNFLHPYPKDAEKHLLAMRSGLSRSQVSNWFINARVRLWKPMIEEMYMEMNKRRARDLYEQGSDETRRV